LDEQSKQVLRLNAALEQGLMLPQVRLISGCSRFVVSEMEKVGLIVYPYSGSIILVEGSDQSWKNCLLLKDLRFKVLSVWSKEKIGFKKNRKIR